MPDPRFPVTLAGLVPVVGAPGEIDTTNASGLRTALVEASRMGRVTVVDLRQTRFCDSAGLQALAVAHRQAHQQDGELLLVPAGAAVLRILAITGVSQVIPSFATLDEAVARASDMIADASGTDPGRPAGVRTAASG